MPGVAIGRPIKNRYLYGWVQKMRQKFGGIIITPKNALKEGIKALQQGKFLGIVGDQGMPESSFSSSFLGRKAWTSTAPALLAYKSGCPLIVATTVRQNGHYTISYSDPIFPNKEHGAKEEVPRLMQERGFAGSGGSQRERIGKLIQIDKKLIRWIERCPWPCRLMGLPEKEVFEREIEELRRQLARLRDR